RFQEHVMSLIAQTISAAERIPLPDLVIRTGIRTLVGRTANRLAQGPVESDELFAAQMARRAIAEETDAANSQHYEVPASFFAQNRTFDRVVSVEMFEHMMNWRALLARARSWLKADGRLFMHIFTHRSGAYLFDRADKEDWIAQYFFTGGVMPSHQLIRQYAD